MPEGPCVNSPNAANLVADFSKKVSTAMSNDGRLSNLSSAPIGLVLNAPVILIERTTSRCIRSNGLINHYKILINTFAHSLRNHCAIWA